MIEWNPRTYPGFKETEAVIPIFRMRRDIFPESVGSGILLKIGDNLFLISAAHVLDCPDPLLIPCDGRLVELQGSGRISVPPESGRKNDLHDSGFICIEPALAARLVNSGYCLSAGEIEMSDETEDGDLYVFSGFPWTEQRPNPAQSSTFSTRFCFAGPTADLRSYRKAGVSRNTHIAIKTTADNFRTSAGKMIPCKSMEGVSGGAAFKLYFHPPNLLSVRLVGIIIEQHKRLGCFVAIRINGVIETIRAQHPAIRNLIIDSKTLNIIPVDPNDLQA